jgi:hypothetical protein
MFSCSSDLKRVKGVRREALGTELRCPGTSVGLAHTCRLCKMASPPNGNRGGLPPARWPIPGAPIPGAPIPGAPGGAPVPPTPVHHMPAPFIAINDMRPPGRAATCVPAGPPAFMPAGPPAPMPAMHYYPPAGPPAPRPAQNYVPAGPPATMYSMQAGPPAGLPSYPMSAPGPHLPVTHPAPPAGPWGVPGAAASSGDTFNTITPASGIMWPGGVCRLLGKALVFCMRVVFHVCFWDVHGKIPVCWFCCSRFLHVLVY